MSSKRWRSCKVEVDVGLFTMGYMVYPLANHHIPYGWPFIAHSQTELIFFSCEFHLNWIHEMVWGIQLMGAPF